MLWAVCFDVEARVGVGVAVGSGCADVSRRNLHFILKSFYRSLPDRFKAFIFFVIPRLTFIPPFAPFLNFFLLLPLAAALLMLLERRALLRARAAVLSNASGPDPSPIGS